MFRIIDFNALNKAIVVLTVGVSIAAYEAISIYFASETSIFRLLGIASSVSVAIIFLINSRFVSRKLWWFLGLFNKALFPDLNGEWSGEILYGDNKSLEVRAVIRQTLTYTQIDTHTPTSKSMTLETTPTMEGGQFKLYHIYRATPRNQDWSVYTGSTIFDIRRIKEGDKFTIELSGAYYTDRKANGRIRLKKISDNENADVSFY